LSKASGENLARRGAVAMAVGNGGWRLRQDDGIGSGGEVNRSAAWLLAKALPAVHPAHGGLAGGEQDQNSIAAVSADRSES
jgi:hypothetical protein